MGTKYSSTSISGYNSAPPADDGSTAASNQVKWSTIKTKLADPFKAAIEGINSKLVTALDTTARLVTTTDSTVAGDHQRTLEVPSSVTTTFTISLGDAATMANGYIVTIRNNAAVSITVGRVTVGDTIDGAASNVTLVSGSAATFAVNASGNGYNTIADVSVQATDTSRGLLEIATGAEALAGSDATRAVTSSGLASSKSLASSGYMKLPGGLIIQWGTGTSGTTGVVITFPTAFASACYSVVAVCSNSTNPSSPQCSGISTTGFTATVSSGTPAIFYIAIGQ